MNTTTTTLASLTTLATLRPALQAVSAYGKVARYNVEQMRAYAAKVAEVRAAGNAEALTADNVDEVLAAVRADAAKDSMQAHHDTAAFYAKADAAPLNVAPVKKAAPAKKAPTADELAVAAAMAARAVDGAPKQARKHRPLAIVQDAPAAEAAPVAAPKAAKVKAPKADKAEAAAPVARAARDAQVAQLCALGTVDRDTFAKVTGKTTGGYWTRSAWRMGDADSQPATWNSVYTACVRLGMEATFDADKKLLTVAQLGKGKAQAQRDALEASVALYRAALAERRA